MKGGQTPYLSEKGIPGCYGVCDRPDRGPRDNVVMVVIVVLDVLRDVFVVFVVVLVVVFGQVRFCRFHLSLVGVLRLLRSLCFLLFS